MNIKQDKNMQLKKLFKKNFKIYIKKYFYKNMSDY